MIIYRAVDITTGEVVFERWEDKIDSTLDTRNSWQGNAVVRRQLLDNGSQCWTVEMEGTILFTGWKKKAPRKRGGRKSYVKLMPEEIGKLKDEQICALTRLAPYIMPDGSLKDEKRRRHLPKNAVVKAFGYGKDKNRRIWQELMDAEILEVKDKVVYLNKNYLSRG